MPTAPLPENPSLEHLKSQAKLIRDLIRGGDPGALSMIDEFHPRLDAASAAPATLESFKTADAQLIIARMYGFASWAKLRDHLDVVAAHSFSPLAERKDRDGPDGLFVVSACLDYSEADASPADRLRHAHQLLAADPSLATRSIDSLATVGDYVGLQAALDAEPALINELCGPNRWPPLLYATYSRIDPDDASLRDAGVDTTQWSAIKTVQVLLERGADPNAGFLWRGLVPPFTALTGAFGGGESHQAWHRERLPIARLLLEAGADPNDGQTLYNNGIGGQNHDDPAHLQLLAEFGLGTEQHGPWYERLGDQLRNPGELLYDELEAATKRDRPAILRWLISLGLDLTRPIGRSQLPPVRIAAAQGHDQILDILAAAGVEAGLTPVEEALRCTRSNNVESLAALLAAHTGLGDTLLLQQPGLIKSTGPNDVEMLTYLIELGFDINDRSDTKTALHHAAEGGDTIRARLLIDHGADPNVVDTHIGATPWGWANYFGHHDTAEFLRPLTEDDDSE